MSGPRHGILERIGLLAGAHAFREILQAVFLIVLARRQMITYGQFMLAMGFGQILLMFAEFGLNKHTICRLAHRPDTETGLVWQVTAVKSLLLALGGGATFLFVLVQSYGLSLGTVILLLSAGVGFDALTSTFYALYQWRGDQRREAAVRSVAAAAGFGYGLAALALGLPPAALALYKLVESLAALAGAMLPILRSSQARPLLPGPSAIGATLRDGLVFALIELAAILYNKANLFFLQRAAGPGGVAQYSATWQIVDGATNLVCGLLLARTLFPLFARLLGTDFAAARDLARDTARWLLPVAACLMYGLAIESDRLIPLLYGGEYADAAWMQRWLIISVAIGLFHNLAAYLMLSLGRQALLLGICAAGLVLNIALCALWIPGRPLAGSIAALLATKGAVALCTLGYAQRRLGLLRLRPLAETGAAALAGAVLLFVLRPLGVRLVAESAALLPMLALMLRWKRRTGHGA
ncbi:MAG TPA: oligosaccharide flippase family protein [Kiritimatiellia bacterium]|nr:oligosaccharide flippase family protein [Kiritimatiellia bacterium]HRZ11754.1 oligosaccharide flippase family protein [Kiritimatiellia bacterium]HSA17439.1 oligosaccharide flippase family protein [Kiritimatiellia bacterium]